jgi:hypothetical protein
MFQLKSLSNEGIAAALEKAERYRLLNEPREAESICLDVLEIDPENQKALVILLLSITDRFDRRDADAARHARELLPRLHDEYERTYYAGIIFERQAKSILKRGTPGGGFQAYDWFRNAMDLFEKAESIRPPGNDDALLRWNTCARTIMRYKLTARQEDYVQPFLE